MRKRSIGTAEKLPAPNFDREVDAFRRMGDASLDLSATGVPAVSGAAAGAAAAAAGGPGAAYTAAAGGMASPSSAPSGPFGLASPAGGRRRASIELASGRHSPTGHGAPTSPGAATGDGAGFNAAPSTAPPGRRRSSLLRHGADPAARPELFTVPTMITPNMTWRYIGGSSSLQDKPAMRHEVLSLVRKYEHAMAYCAKVTALAAAGEGSLTAGDPALDADLATCRGMITKLFTERCLPAGAQPVIARGTTPASPEIQAISASVMASRKAAPASGGASARRTALSKLSEITIDPSLLHQLMDTPVFQDCIAEMSLGLLEQKWTDLTLEEAENQIAVSAHEHGVLLHQLRTHNAHVVQSCFSTVLRLALGLQHAQATIKSMEAEVVDARRARGDIEKDIRAEYESQRRELERELKETKETSAAQVAEAQDQVTRLSDSLKTLNAVFKKMRGDDDILKIADLKEAAARLERKLTERTRELEALQPVKVQLRRAENELEQANRHIARLQTEVLELRRELAKQMSVARSAVESHAERAAGSAVAAVRAEAVHEHAEYSVASKPPPLALSGRPPSSAFSRTEGVRSARPGAALQPLVRDASVADGGWGTAAAEAIRSAALSAATSVIPGLEFLCARCNNSLMSAVERQAVGTVMEPRAARLLLGQLAGQSSRPYIPCMYYRLLLPALPPLATEIIERLTAAAAAVEAEKLKSSADAEEGGAAKSAAVKDATTLHPIDQIEVAFPKRPVEWIRWCMRAILLSKMRDDSLASSGRPDACAAAGRKQRMPEFVFAWFEHGQTPLDLAAQAAAILSGQAVRSGGATTAAAGGVPEVSAARAAIGQVPGAAIIRNGIGQLGGVAAAGTLRTVLAQGGVPALRPTETPKIGPRFASGGSSDGAGGGAADGGSGADASKKTPSSQWGLSSADEARWAFYFGLRALAREDPEAKLFYALLDERHGEDEQAFLLFCLSTVDGMLPLPLPWGPTYAACDFGDTPPLLSSEDDVLRLKHRLQSSSASASASTAANRRGSTSSASTASEAPQSRPASVSALKLQAAPGGAAGNGASSAGKEADLPPDHVWIPLSYALQASARVLSRVPQDEVLAVLQRVKSRSVSSEGRLSGLGSMHTTAPSALQYLRGIGGEQAVAAELYGTEYQARLTTSSADAILRKRRGLDGADARCIDLFIWIRMLVFEFREEQARRRASIRMMFHIALTQVATTASMLASAAGVTSTGTGVSASDTTSAAPPRGSVAGAPSHPALHSAPSSASLAAATLRTPVSKAPTNPPGRLLPALSMSASAPTLPASTTSLLRTPSVPSAPSENTPSAVLPPPSDSTAAGVETSQAPLTGVTLRQFSVIVALISPDYPAADTAALYRDAYIAGGGVVNYDSFMVAAEARQFFSTCLRLPPHMGTERISHLTTEQATQLAYLVNERFTVLEHDLGPWLAQLPPGWANLVKRGRDAVELELEYALRPLTALESVLEAPQQQEGLLVKSTRAPTLTQVSSVNVMPDGRRMVTAYRRYLDLLLFLRACNRADRGEAGGPQAVRAIDGEFRALENVLRRDAQALTPDVLTLKRMLRAGIPLRLEFALRRPQDGITNAVLRAPRMDAATRDVVHGRVTGVIPMDPPAAGEELSAEELAARLGVDAYAGDELVQMRSNEASNLVAAAARVVAGIKVARSVRRRFPLFMQRKREKLAAMPAALPPPAPAPAGLPGAAPTATAGGPGASSSPQLTATAPAAAGRTSSATPSPGTSMLASRM